jgi:long-chain acyl-CoA synthetase
VNAAQKGETLRVAQAGGPVAAREPAVRGHADAAGTDIIPIETAATLDGLFRERVRRSPGSPAYRHFDAAAGGWRTLTWSDMANEIARWCAALEREPLQRGDRVAVWMHNRVEWVLFDQAALSLGLVVVPLFFNDRTDNIVYILEDAGARLLLIEGEEQWRTLCRTVEPLEELLHVVSLERIDAPDDERFRLVAADDWLGAEARINHPRGDPESLATIVYTSGTTGRPKGVMLSHRNILADAHCAMADMPVRPSDLFLSFLPLSHTLERTVGYYIPVMAGACVAFCRSIPNLAEDLETQRPTALVSVPRIFERIYARTHEKLAAGSFVGRALLAVTIAVGWRRFLRQQGRARWTPLLTLWPALDRLVASRVRARLGGRLRIVISGGAPLAFKVSRWFLALGLPVQQGYGLTEASPVICVNPLHDNEPASVGPAIRNVEVRVGPDKELLVRGPNVMIGYWNNHKATYAAIDPDGWLHTGDQARIDGRHVYIIGRLKEILVLANGEKVPPADVEMAIAGDSLIDQVLIVGEGRPFLSALVVLNPDHWESMARRAGLDPDDPASLQSEDMLQQVVKRIGERLEDFPGHAQVYRAALLVEPWTVDNDLQTPTLKLRRSKILQRHEEQIEAMYSGHELDDGDGGKEAAARS